MLASTRPRPLSAFVLTLALFTLAAAPSPAAWWTEEAPSLARVQAMDELATMYRTFRVDHDAFRAATEGIPRAYTGDEGRIFELPTPDGEVARFRIVEDSILSPELAAKRPDARFYAGVGVDDPMARVRLGITDDGVHAKVRSVNGGWTMDWAPESGPDIATAWWDGEAAPRRFGCGTNDAFESVQFEEDLPGLSRRLGEALRTYRFAITATGEFTTQAGGVSATESIMMTLTNLMTTLYTNEFAVRFELVGMNVYTNAATDPFPNGGVLDGNLLLQNDQALDAEIGVGNYDLGHIISANPGQGAGGLAFVGVQCNGTYKGAGGTLLGAATAGAVYPIMIHEIGHQLGSRHSFNSTQNGCSGNRSSSSAYEIGSGVTIMSYAGLCGSENVQNDDIDVFNVGSWSSITSRIASTSFCGSTQPTGNSAPQVAAPSTVQIPRGTAFELTADATDAEGDDLTYSWEHHDLGPASPPVDPNDGPMFRVFGPTTSPTRSFPEYNAYRRGSVTAWEFLASVDRTTAFRVLVRDNNLAAGGATVAGQTVIFEGDPFVVTGPSGGESFEGGTEIAVTWDVGGSVSTDVRILVSEDDGETWVEAIAATPNDGFANVLLPCTPTIEGRIRIEGIDNPFFDLNEAEFSVTAETQPPVINSPVAVTITTDDPSGVASDSPLLQPWLDSITVDDNCGETIEASVLLPPTLPIGNTVVPITATDAQGNLGFATTTVVVELDDATDSPSVGRLVTGFVKIAPNPFNPRTTVEFAVDRAQRAALNVFDARGRRVAVLADGEWPVGRHEVVWNGTDADGRQVPSGVYFMRLETEDGSFSERAVLLK